MRLGVGGEGSCFRTCSSTLVVDRIAWMGDGMVDEWMNG